MRERGSERCRGLILSTFSPGGVEQKILEKHEEWGRGGGREESSLKVPILFKQFQGLLYFMPNNLSSILSSLIILPTIKLEKEKKNRTEQNRKRLRMHATAGKVFNVSFLFFFLKPKKEIFNLSLFSSDPCKILNSEN